MSPFLFLQPNGFSSHCDLVISMPPAPWAPLDFKIQPQFLSQPQSLGLSFQPSLGLIPFCSPGSCHPRKTPSSRSRRPLFCPHLVTLLPGMPPGFRRSPPHLLGLCSSFRPHRKCRLPRKPALWPSRLGSCPSVFLHTSPYTSSHLPCFHSEDRSHVCFILLSGSMPHP